MHVDGTPQHPPRHDYGHLLNRQPFCALRLPMQLGPDHADGATVMAQGFARALAIERAWQAADEEALLDLLQAPGAGTARRQ